MSGIEAEARTRFQLTDCIVIHRVGELRPGDNIVLVVTAAPHRQAAFEAAAFLMDYLKTRAPFWKKETDASGGRPLGRCTRERRHGARAAGNARRRQPSRRDSRCVDTA